MTVGTEIESLAYQIHGILRAIQKVTRVGINAIDGSSITLDIETAFGLEALANSAAKAQEFLAEAVTYSDFTDMELQIDPSASVEEAGRKIVETLRAANKAKALTLAPAPAKG